MACLLHAGLFFISRDLETDPAHLLADEHQRGDLIGACWCGSRWCTLMTPMVSPPLTMGTERNAS